MNSSRSCPRALLHPQQSETPAASLLLAESSSWGKFSSPLAEAPVVAPPPKQGFSPILCGAEAAPPDLGQDPCGSVSPPKWVLAVPFLPGHLAKPASGPAGGCAAVQTAEVPVGINRTICLFN